jgi:hypothetical protein
MKTESEIWTDYISFHGDEYWAGVDITDPDFKLTIMGSLHFKRYQLGVRASELI